MIRKESTIVNTDVYFFTLLMLNSMESTAEGSSYYSCFMEFYLYRFFFFTISLIYPFQGYFFTFFNYLIVYKNHAISKQYKQSFIR